MNARLIKFWQDLQSSYYFIPGLMAVAAIFLAVLTSHIDKTFEYSVAEKLGWFYSNKADGARAILTTIASSMMTVAAVTFSITMVAVTSAAGQYGPRLIGNFMRDRANQITLGTFTSTFVYCLLILRVARTGDGSSAENSVAEFVPNVSLLVAMGLTLGSVAVMIYFIHHIPETLNVGNITGKVGRQLREDIEKMFPENMGDEDSFEDPDISTFDPKRAISITSKAEGYIQAVNERNLITMAREQDWVIRMFHRAGDFTTLGDTLLCVWTAPHKDTEISAEDVKKLQASYAMGQDRTANQNVLFLADELVEILGRALSPGINDPYTAINCINWFHSAIKAYMRASIPSPFRRDENGDVRVIAFPVSFERFLSVICDRSRPYICSDRNATLSMINILTEAAVVAPTKAYRDLLHHQIERFLKTAQESLPNILDRDEVLERVKISRKIISDPESYEGYRAEEFWVGGQA